MVFAHLHLIRHMKSSTFETGLWTLEKPVEFASEIRQIGHSFLLF